MPRIRLTGCANPIIPVRQYRLLPFDFVTPAGRYHGSVHGSAQTTLSPANASATTPCIRDLHPLENKSSHSLAFIKIILHFCIFSDNLQQVCAPAHAGRTLAIYGHLQALPLAHHKACKRHI